MAENIPKPGINLKYENLEELVAINYDDLVLELAAGVEDIGGGEAFVDLALELDYPHTQSYSQGISQALAGERDCPESRMSGYRAFHFANGVGNMLMSGETGMSMEYFYGKERNYTVIRAMLTNAVGDYFATRPALNLLTGRFMPELDPSGKYGDVAEIMAGSTFMFLDAFSRNKAVEAEVGRFAAELAAMDAPRF